MPSGDQARPFSSSGLFDTLRRFLPSASTTCTSRRSPTPRARNASRQPLALLVYAGIVLALALCASSYFGSKPRLLMPAFPLLLPLARALAGARTPRSATIVGAVGVASALYGAFWLNGSGPP